ncbi:MAG: hypothetical protein ABFS14_01995 [Gemmatimonadota bacterium]
MRSTSRIFLAVAASAAMSGCGPRQVVVGTDTPPSAPEARQVSDQANNEILQEELGRFADAQEEHYSDHDRFADSADALGFAAMGGIRLDVLQGDQSGYSAIARLGDSECGIFSGDVRAPRTYVTRAGVADCRP